MLIVIVICLKEIFLKKYRKEGKIRGNSMSCRKRSYGEGINFWRICLEINSFIRIKIIK